jgi:hypothetical protein
MLRFKSFPYVSGGLSFFYAIFLLCCFSCSRDIPTLSGGSSEIGNAKVSGVIVDASGSPAVSAKVNLIPSNFNPVTDPVDKIVSGVTDADGKFTIIPADTGVYTLQVTQSSGRTRLSIYNIKISKDSSLELDRAALSVPGAIKVIQSTSGEVLSGYIYIPGTTIKTLISNDTGNILLDSVAPGTIPGIFLSDDTAKLLRADIPVSPDSTTIVSNPGWICTKKFYFNTTDGGAGVSGNVYNFPVLIRLTKSNFDFSQAQPNGSDIRFAKADFTPLAYEIERWDSKTEKAEIWVNMDTVFGKDSMQYIIMYWGNEDALGCSNGTAVFDTATGFTGVWHLNENPAAGVNSIKDRSANGFNATPTGDMKASAVKEGMIGNGLEFDGTDDALDAGNINITGNYSISLWVKANSLSSNFDLVSKQDAYELWYDTASKGIRVEQYSGNAWKGIPEDGGAVGSVTSGEWTLITGVFDGDRIRLYLNGIIISETNIIGYYPQTGIGNMLLGGGYGQKYTNGIIDEVRIENVARSAGWIKLCYMNQGNNDRLVYIK